MTTIPQPGQTVRLARRLGFRLAGAEAVVVETRTSLLNGHQFAADFGGDHGVLCLDIDDVEET